MNMEFQQSIIEGLGTIKIHSGIHLFLTLKEKISKDYYLYKNGKLYQITTMELNNREILEIKWRKFFYYDDNNNIIKVERYVHYGSYYHHHSNYDLV